MGRSHQWWIRISTEFTTSIGNRNILNFKIQTGLVDTNGSSITLSNLQDKHTLWKFTHEYTIPSVFYLGEKSWITPLVVVGILLLVELHIDNDNGNMVDRYIGIDLTSDLITNGSTTFNTWRQVIHLNTRIEHLMHQLW